MIALGPSALALGEFISNIYHISLTISYLESAHPITPYTRHRVKGEVTQWHCVQRSYCKARLHTKGNNVIARKNTHSHENNSPIFYNSQAKAGMKRKACESQVPTHSIMTTYIGQLSEESAVHLPKLNTLKKSIVRSRNKAENVPPAPTYITTASRHS